MRTTRPARPAAPAPSSRPPPPLGPAAGLVRLWGDARVSAGLRGDAAGPREDLRHVVAMPRGRVGPGAAADLEGRLDEAVALGLHHLAGVGDLVGLADLDRDRVVERVA